MEGESRNLNTQDDTPNFEVHYQPFGQSINLEALKNDKEALKKIVEILKEYYETRSTDPVIHLSSKYEDVNIHSLTYYLGYQLGLTDQTGGYDADYNKSLTKYLELLLEDPVAAETYLVDLQAKKSEHSHWIADNADLSKIIPGAPQVVNTALSGHDQGVNFLYHPEEKVSDLPRYAKSEAFMQELKEFFKNKTVIELGAGEYAAGLRAADAFEAHAYVGVEARYAIRLLADVEFAKQNGEIPHIDKFHIARSDMLEFLRRIPSAQRDITFLMSGIDEYILGTTKFTDNEVERNAGIKYMKDTFSEIRRIMGENCYLVEYASFTPENAYYGQESPFKIVKKFKGGESSIDIFQ